MKTTVLIFFLIGTIVSNSAQMQVPDDNNSIYQDMYAIKAAVYHVGILTNKTQSNDSDIGDREELTFYRQKGTELNLDSLPRPLVTNVTGETLAAVAPSSPHIDSEPWVYLEDADSGHLEGGSEKTGGGERSIRSEEYSYEENSSSTNSTSVENNNGSWYPILKRSSESPNKNGVATDAILKVVHGTAVINDEAGMKSIDLPPFLSFKSNRSYIHVPIPDTSVINYSRVDASMIPANP